MFLQLKPLAVSSSAQGGLGGRPMLYFIDGKDRPSSSVKASEDKFVQSKRGLIRATLSYVHGQGEEKKKESNMSAQSSLGEGNNALVRYMSELWAIRFPVLKMARGARQWLFKHLPFWFTVPLFALSAIWIFTALVLMSLAFLWLNNHFFKFNSNSGVNSQLMLYALTSV